MKFSKILTILLLLLSISVKSQTLTNAMLDDFSADKQSWSSYESQNGIISIGDTLLLGTPNGKTSDTYAYVYPYTIEGMAAMGALGSPVYPLNSRVYEDKEIIVTGIRTVGGKKGRKIQIEFSTNNKAFGSIKHITVLDGRESIRINEIYKKGFLTRDQAIAKLKESKELLDLGIMTQEDYDKLKTELTPIITGK